MKQPIRSFALGLLSAGIILLATFYFTGDSRNAKNLSTDKMIASIEAEGYHVMTESEYISVSVKSDEGEKDKENKKDDSTTEQNGKNQQQNKEKASKDNNSESKKDSSKDKKKDSSEKKTVTYTIKIESGMVPSTISDKLAKNNIIKNADEFTQYMEEQGYVKKVQLGKFKLTSDMSHYEIAEELTN